MPFRRQLAHSESPRFAPALAGLCRTRIPAPQEVREKALDRFCRRVLDECETICQDDTETAH